MHCHLRSAPGSDSSSSYGSDSESGASSCTSGSSDGGFACVDLTYERLVSLQPHVPKTSTVYSKGGASSKRVKHALKHPVCQCACKVPFNILLRICLAFWALVKNDQDSLLWSIQHESGQQKRKQWFLQGLAVVGCICFIIFQSKYMILEMPNVSSPQDIKCAVLHGHIFWVWASTGSHGANMCSKAKI